MDRLVRTDVVTFAGTAFISGINQAADAPAYQQGWKGYGQRLGAFYASSFSDIMSGGALLPSIEAPFVAGGDNGRWHPNYSSVGGDLASATHATTYYLPGPKCRHRHWQRVG